MNMDYLYSLILILAAFLLGACPFSVWIGRCFFKKDITRYGDGNPGAANVFRAGKNIHIGLLAVLLDILKGIPFVYISYAVFDLPMSIVTMTGFAAILGHAFSPFLHFNGGKSVCVTFGVIIAMPQVDILAVFVLLTLFGFLFIEQHSWVVIPAPLGTMAYLLVSRNGGSWEALLMLCVLTLFVVKQFDELRSVPRFKMKIAGWLQSRSGQT